MTTQLERDLSMRCKERTFKLCQDLFELYEMAGLSELKAAEGILTAFFMETASLVATTSAKPIEAGEMMYKMVITCRQIQQKQKQQNE